MSVDRNCRRILVVGTDESIIRAGIAPASECEIELIASLQEAAQKHAEGGYDLLVVDPSVLDVDSFQILADARLLESAVGNSTPSNAPLPDHKSERILESTSEAFFSLDSNWAFTSVNSQATRHFSKSREELIGVNIWDHFPQMADSSVEAAYRQVMESRLPVQHEEWEEHTGRCYSHSVHPTPEGITVYWTDITQRKIAERLLDRYRLHSENSLDIMLFLNRDGQIVEANDTAVNAYGYTLEELLGLSIFDIGDDYMQDTIRELVLKADSQGVVFETSHRRKDESTFAAEVSCCGIVVDGQRLLLCIIRDISKRRRAEEQARHRHRVLDGINRVFREAIACETEEELGRICLRVAEEVTESKFGFVGEINEQGMLDDIAISDTGWAACRMATPIGHRTVPGGFPINGICRRMLSDPRGFFANDPSSLPESRGTPEGHPVLNSVLGVPLIHDDKIIGVVMVANREGGYRDDDLQAMEALSYPIVQVFRRWRAEQARTLAQREAEHRAAEIQSFMASTVDGLSMSDPQGRVIFMNEAARRIYDLPPDIPIRDWAIKTQRITLEGEPIPFEERVLQRALNGEVIQDYRYKIITPLGKELFISVSAAPVLDGQNELVGTVSTVRDISTLIELERRQQEHFEREHRIAKVLQQAIVPPEVPSEIHGYKLAVAYRPALNEAEIGGDFYDIFDLGDGKVGIVVGDVAGKGLPAAIRVASVRHAIRSYAYLDSRPERVMRLTNDALCREESDESEILTAFFAVLDTSIGVVTYASAGHEPPITCDLAGRCVEHEIGGIPLGIVSGVKYGQTSIRLDPGDMVVCVTDGITEAHIFGSDMFGKPGLMRFVKQNCQEPPRAIAKGILETAAAHAGGSLHDDAAVVLLKAPEEGGC